MPSINRYEIEAAAKRLRNILETKEVNERSICFQLCEMMVSSCNDENRTESLLEAM